MAAVIRIPSWLCSNGAKSEFVRNRIVHPSGHIELRDGPVQAAEIILRNPEFSQSQSTHHPRAIVSPDTTLMLGRKYYLFPENTVGLLQWRKLEWGEDLEGDMVNNNKRGVFLQNGNIRGVSQRSFDSSDNYWQLSLNSISQEY